MQHMLRMGIDVGSTTVKVVLLDEHDNYLYKKYVRHYANILDTVYTLLQEAQVGHEDDLVHVCITGSGGMAMAEKVRIPFVQEGNLFRSNGRTPYEWFLCWWYRCFHRPNGDLIAN